MKRTTLFPIFLCVAVCSARAAAEIRFAAGFGNGMVLQRDMPVSISGSGTPGTTAVILLGSDRSETEVAADGVWRVDFPARTAGGPWTVSASSGGSETVLEDVWIGDVWLFSGQSNMQMGLDEAENGPAEIAAADGDLPVRLLSVPKAAADVPKDDPGAEWRRVSPDSLRKFSAVGWFFAKHLRKDPALADVPLGLIDASFGGTAVEAWIPEGSLPELPVEQHSASMFGIAPGSLFNGMIAPLTTRPIKGVAWYQGEANAGKPDPYPALLGGLMDGWRKRWNQDDLPFFIVQLPSFDGTMGNLDFSWLRGAQAAACERDQNAWLAVTHDTTDGFDLHPREKEEIGRRLSLLARREVFKESVVAHGPRVGSVAKENGGFIVEFDQEPVAPEDEDARGFAIAGADGEFRFAEASIDGRRVSVRAEAVADPVSLRYAWASQPDANLTNSDGLPVEPFRNDREPPHTLAFQALPTVHRIETPCYSLETGRGGSVAGLVSGGRQFLSNEPGGGTSIPAGFGAKNLSKVTPLGPRRIRLADGSASLELACRDDAMTWTVRNTGGDAFDFLISPATGVEISRDAGGLVLSRGEVRIRLTGAVKRDDGRLAVSVPSGGERSLSWEFPR